MLALRRFQLFGHHPIALAGGATGSIGDPSGKTAERQLLSREKIAANIASVKGQLRRLLDFESGTNPARLLGADAGRLVQGAEAVIALIDPVRPWVVDSDQMAAAAGNTPFDKQGVEGRVTGLFKGGVAIEI